MTVGVTGEIGDGMPPTKLGKGVSKKRAPTSTALEF